MKVMSDPFSSKQTILQSRSKVFDDPRWPTILVDTSRLRDMIDLKDAKVADLVQSSEISCGTSEQAAIVQRAPSSQRWVPPTVRENTGPTEIVFRKIRGILNKLTPDNFEKLSFELARHAGINNKEILKGAILLVFDKALDEPKYSSMYAELCLTLNKFAPNFEESSSQKTTFCKLLLHKCQEEFERRRQATAAFEKRDGLSPEEVEQKAIAKRKMLGNIKFVGELFKLGILHEAIIHSCIKELLERKKSQSVEDASQSIECLCHIMTTVGSKLDTDKAKGWMDKYFNRISSLSTNKELPVRIRFMLLDVIDLRDNNWQPRRASSGSSPRPIHEIRQEAYIEHNSPRITSKHSPSLGVATFAPAQKSGSPSRYSLGDEGFMSLSSNSQHSLRVLSPQDGVSMSFVAQSRETAPSVDGSEELVAEKKAFKMIPVAKSDRTVSLRPSKASLKLGSAHHSKNSDLSSGKSGATDAERTVVMENKSEKHKEKGGAKRSLPRTRDDSSDEEDISTSCVPATLPNDPGKAHPYPGVYPPPVFYPQAAAPNVPYQLPRAAVLPPQDPFLPSHSHKPQSVLPPPLRGLVPGAHGLMPMVYLPPHSHAPPGHVIQHRPRPGFRSPLPPPLPPGGYYHPPFPPPPPHPGAVQPPTYNYPGQVRYAQPPPPSTLSWNSPPELASISSAPLISDIEKSTASLALEKREPLLVKYSSKPAKKTGKKGAEDENEKILEPLLSKYLKNHNVEDAVEAFRSLKMNKKTMCSLLITKSLGKSEDDRTCVSDLFKELKETEVITSEQFYEVLTSVLNSARDIEVRLPQCKTYLAGFIARGIALNVIDFSRIAAMFDQGAHHPTALVVLQALTASLGEFGVLELFQKSNVKLASLLPLEHRSHNAISKLMETKHLSFLYPLKRIQSELTLKLKQDSSAASIYKWIKVTVDPSLYPTSEFVMVLTRCILEHVTGATTLASTNVGLSKKQVESNEKELMIKWKGLVERFVSDDIQLQISSLYATQVFCYDKQFPKGLLLRLFSYWYDMDVIEEEAFLKWKEDLSQQYPGKGQALFQVNQWLVLLEEAEPDESSSDEEKE